VEQNILLAITSSKIKLYMYMQLLITLIALMKRNLILIYPLNNLDLKGGVLCVDYNTGKVLNPVYLNSKLDPIKFTVNWYLKGKLLASGLISLLPKKAFMMLSLLKHTDIGNDCGYNPTSLIENQVLLLQILKYLTFRRYNQYYSNCRFRIW
jgi:hypothetical protein